MNPENPSCPAPLVALRSLHRALRWSSGPGDGAPDGLTPEDFHDMARILESMARCIRREADKRWAERKRIGEREKDTISSEERIYRIEIDKISFEEGKEDGKEGRKSCLSFGVDPFSYYSGYIEGEAVRERTKCHLFVPEDCKKESLP